MKHKMGMNRAKMDGMNWDGRATRPLVSDWTQYYKTLPFNNDSLLQLITCLLIEPNITKHYPLTFGGRQDATTH